MGAVERPAPSPESEAVQLLDKRPPPQAASCIPASAPFFPSQRRHQMLVANCVHARANLWRPARICRACCKSATSSAAFAHYKAGGLFLDGPRSRASGGPVFLGSDLARCRIKVGRGKSGTQFVMSSREIRTVLRRWGGLPS